MELADFSAGFPSADSLKRAGFGGVILYFSEARSSWMKGKPATKPIVWRYLDAGLEVVCNYQFGKGATADWRGGRDAGRDHARRMAAHMARAGLQSTDAPCFGPVDDNPTRQQYEQMIRPFFQGWIDVFGQSRSGAYANTHTIDWLVKDGLCDWYWQHAWDGRPNWAPLMPHDHAHILQYEIDAASVDGIGIDRNRTLKENFGGVHQNDFSDTLDQMMGAR